MGNLTGLVFEKVERPLNMLAYLDEIAVGVTHVAAPFPAVIVKRFSRRRRALVAPFFVAGPDIGDTQAKQAIDRVEIRRSFEEDLRFVGRRATAGNSMVARDGVEPPTPAFSGLDSLGLNPFSINNLICRGGHSFVTIL